MKKLLFVFPIVALLAAGCNSAQQASVQTQTPTTQNTNPVPSPVPAVQQTPAPTPNPTPNQAQQSSNPQDWKTFTQSFTSYNFKMSFKYPNNWTVGTFANYPDELTIQPTDTFQAESKKNALVVWVGDNCMNTQCLTRYSLDEIVNGQGELEASTVLKKITLSDGTQGDYVKTSNGVYEYMFVYNNSALITFSTDVYLTWMTKIAPTIQFQQPTTQITKQQAIEITNKSLGIDPAAYQIEASLVNNYWNVNYQPKPPLDCPTCAVNGGDVHFVVDSKTGAIISKKLGP